MTPATANNFSDGTLLAGQSYTDSSNGITISAISASATALTVQVTVPGGAATTTTLASAPNPSTVGANVTTKVPFAVQVKLCGYHDITATLSSVFARLFLRALRRIRSGEELWAGTGNRETFRNQFLSRDTLFWWAIKTHGRRRRVLPQVLGRPEYAHLVVHRFRRDVDAKAWLSSVKGPATADR